MERLTELSTQTHNIRIVVPQELYDKLKVICPEHGQLSQLVRKLLTNYIESSEG